MRKLLILFTVFSVISCTKKEIKIPVLAEKGISDTIFNHSEVWMFFEVENNDTIAHLNRNNAITSTHWIFNIDKRLPLKTFINKLNTLKYKHANSIHSKEGMHNYFSYSDTISKKLSFIKLDSVNYVTDTILSKYYIKKHGDNYVNYNNINLTFSNHTILLNDSEIERQNFKQTLLDFIDFSSEGKTTLLHLNFENTLTYQNYMYFRTLLKNIESSSIIINPKEFIFDKTKVPDCGCN